MPSTSRRIIGEVSAPSHGRGKKNRKQWGCSSSSSSTYTRSGSC